MNKLSRMKWLLPVACCVVMIASLVACQSNAATEETTVPTEAAVVEQTVAPAATTAPSATEVSSEPTADPQQAMIDYLTGLEKLPPDYAPDQIDNPVAKMNSPESLVGSGVFPENYYNSDILHTGARGCSACHADLYTLIKNLGPEMHVASPTTYGRQEELSECVTCHDIAGGLTGPKLGDIIHSVHENNTLFTTAYNGNCWSCHIVDTNGEMALWDLVKYDATMAGYPDATNDMVTGWLTMRGFENGNLTGFDMVEDLGLEVVSQ